MNKHSMRAMALPVALTGAMVFVAGCSNANDDEGSAQTTGAAVDQRLQEAVNRAGISGGPTAAEGVLSAPLRLADNREAGTVYFWPNQRASGSTVLVDLALPEGVGDRRAWHGIHVHANNDPANGEGCVADAGQPTNTHFVSADGHLAEQGTEHGAHTGDLAPVLTRGDGTASLVFNSDALTATELAGKTVILHAKPDNLGNVPTGTDPNQYRPNGPEATDLTNRTGNAGDRVACGVIAAGTGAGTATVAVTETVTTPAPAPGGAAGDGATGGSAGNTATVTVTPTATASGSAGATSSATASATR